MREENYKIRKQCKIIAMVMVPEIPHKKEYKTKSKSKETMKENINYQKE